MKIDSKKIHLKTLNEVYIKFCDCTVSVHLKMHKYIVSEKEEKMFLNMA